MVVPVYTAVGAKLAEFTTEVMAGCVGSVTANVVVAGACEGLLGGAGFVTERIHWIGYTVGPVGTARYAALIVACNTLRLNSFEGRVTDGLVPD